MGIDVNGDVRITKDINVFLVLNDVIIWYAYLYHSLYVVTIVSNDGIIPY